MKSHNEGKITTNKFCILVLDRMMHF